MNVVYKDTDDISLYEVAHKNEQAIMLRVLRANEITESFYYIANIDKSSTKGYVIVSFRIAELTTTE